MLVRLTLEGFTDGVTNVVSKALRLAGTQGHGLVTPQHLLFTSATVDYGPTRRRFAHLGLDLQSSVDEIRSLIGPTVSDAPGRRVRLEVKVRDVLDRARRQAHGMGRRWVGAENLVASLLSGPDCLAVEFLRSRGFSSEVIQAAMTAHRE